LRSDKPPPNLGLLSLGYIGRHIRNLYENEEDPATPELDEQCVPNTSMPKKISKIKGPMSTAIRGAKKPRRKFQNQLVALPSAMDLGRTRRGNDSPRYTHGVGPQKMENEQTCRTAKAMRTSPAGHQ
jgi:hypothetical protein